MIWRGVLWIDFKLLEFFNFIAKRFNWLTGRDNFFLAKICLIGACFAHSSIRKETSSSTIFQAILGLLSIYLRERVVAREQENGVKDPLDAKIWFFLRMIALFFLAMPPYMPIAIHIYTVMAIAMYYLISLDHPPFSRSQAWQKLKGWASGLASSRQEAHSD
ncbi:MAG: hypothetical protein Q7S32_04760 [bacterium]|nr:hypothetical protein [bacterium]